MSDGIVIALSMGDWVCYRYHTVRCGLHPLDAAIGLGRQFALVDERGRSVAAGNAESGVHTLVDGHDPLTGEGTPRLGGSCPAC